MQNPLTTMNLATPSLIVNTFWLKEETPGVYPLQSWNNDDKHRVMHLDVNKRSGGDEWFSSVLDACRLGELDDEDYCFLYGFPTKHCGSWLTQQNKSTCTTAACGELLFAKYAKEMPEGTTWQQHWKELQTKECSACKAERQRRKRVMQCEEFAGIMTSVCTQILRSERFAECVLITKFNKPVTSYGLQRSRLFADIKNSNSCGLKPKTICPEHTLESIPMRSCAH